MPQNTTTFPTLAQVTAELVLDADIDTGIGAPPSAAWLTLYAAIKAARQASGVWTGTP